MGCCLAPAAAPQQTTTLCVGEVPKVPTVARSGRMFARMVTRTVVFVCAGRSAKLIETC